MPFDFDQENESVTISMGQGDTCIGNGNDEAVFIEISDLGQSCCIGQSLPDDATHDGSRVVKIVFPKSPSGLAALRTLAHVVHQTTLGLSIELLDEGLPANEGLRCAFCAGRKNEVDQMIDVGTVAVCLSCIGKTIEEVAKQNRAAASPELSEPS